ncbi:VLRF1 family aeRF1-type release factor [Nitrospira sp. Nam74]
MLNPMLIQSLPKLEAPILTVYLDTNPANPSNQGQPSGARIWLKSQGKALMTSLPRAEEKVVSKQLQRIDNFLKTRVKRERGIAMFAGPKAWRVLRLQVDVDHELHWGQASLTQLLWLLDEHQPSGVVVVDRSGARFYRFWMREVEEQKTERFTVDTSQWRVKNVVRSAGRTATAQRDAFEQRVAANYARLFREAGKRIGRWAAQEKLDMLFIAGTDDVVESVWNNIPDKTRVHATRLMGDYARLSAAALQDHVGPEIDRWKRTQEAAMVADIMEQRNQKRAVLGIDQTLAAIQDGRARLVIVARGVRGRVKQCLKCGWADRAADPLCPVCGGQRRLVTLREALPALVRRVGVPVDVVAGRAATKLKTVGGLAAWLRE